MMNVTALWKALKITGLGLVIWSLGLLWPEMDLLLLLAVALATALFLGSVWLIANHNQPSTPHRPDPKPRSPSRPVAVH